MTEQQEIEFLQKKVRETSAAIAEQKLLRSNYLNKLQALCTCPPEKVQTGFENQHYIKRCTVCGRMEIDGV